MWEFQVTYLRAVFMQESWSGHPPATHLIYRNRAARKSSQKLMTFVTISCSRYSVLIKHAWKKLLINNVFIWRKYWPTRIPISHNFGRLPPSSAISDRCWLILAPSPTRSIPEIRSIWGIETSPTRNIPKIGSIWAMNMWWKYCTSTKPWYKCSPTI